MNAGRFDRLSEIFQEARERPAAARPEYLDRACAGDASLREEVEQLLRHHDGAGVLDAEPPPVIDDILGRAVTDEAPSARGELPERIGRYRVLSMLGEGGMGVVLLAEQDNPRRKVALKILRPGVVSPSVLRRFEHEAQLLGRLHHAGIAQIYEAGSASLGAGTPQPFFAMEYVEGLPITRFARAEHLDTRGRLELLARVCDAVHHAHQRGVVHRDLKPANILVAADDSPKVSDFGLAKLEDEMSISSAGELLGTYYYMSPEQVATKRAGIDHRTDIFSLGVVMYEMLALVRPFEGDTTEQVAQKILWEEAPDPKAIRSRVPTDLAVICGKAMEKDPGRRYQTMAELAEDLRRYLSGEPILAQAPTAAQRAIKWTRRNPTKSA
ncbi:MAG: serine/threonine-protein kinase, partial [Planctomycetota bacterium]|nr:serine/threonine-protein kinase [Planctomycetota bacterium]